jgi:1-acyl-sn-glycerol-3-phosphate acyltransferase
MRGIHAGLRVLIGLTYEVRGTERLPATPAIIASKHQSAWETLTLHLLVHDLAVGLKHELTRVPLLGWYFVKGGAIRIDRGGAARALRSLVEGARRAAARGCSILIFPEGTRRAPDDPPDYKPGVAALYEALHLPVVPVALNSGLFWGRRSFLKRPGRVVVEFEEPIPPGLARRQLMAELERRTETATARLVAEGRERYGA